MSFTLTSLRHDLQCPARTTDGRFLDIEPAGHGRILSSSRVLLRDMYFTGERCYGRVRETSSRTVCHDRDCVRSPSSSSNPLPASCRTVGFGKRCAPRGHTARCSQSLYRATNISTFCRCGQGPRDCCDSGYRLPHDYGPNDKEISKLYKGNVDPARVNFDPVEIERIDFYSLNHLQEMMNSKESKFSYWFEQILHWYLGDSSALEVLKEY